MMNRKKVPYFKKSNRGGMTAEFVIVVFAMIVMIFFVVELTTLYFSIMSAQMAAHMGARVAVVSEAAVQGVPPLNNASTTGIAGVSCSDVSNPCIGFATVTCTGGSCNTASFTRILARMRQFLGGIAAENITISYAYTGLGYAGGATIPAVTVTIGNVPYNAGIIGHIIGTEQGPFTTLPMVSVTITGEDLSQSGA
jgi:Flp pilus assembly protein TadG